MGSMMPKLHEAAIVPCRAGVLQVRRYVLEVARYESDARNTADLLFSGNRLYGVRFTD